MSLCHPHPVGYLQTHPSASISIPYNFINMDMGAGELSTEWFKSINPNGRAPAIVHVKEDGTSVTVFESAACLLYMASEFDREHKISYPIGTPEYWSQLSWVSGGKSVPFCWLRKSDSGSST